MDTKNTLIFRNQVEKADYELGKAVLLLEEEWETFQSVEAGTGEDKQVVQK